MLNDACGCVIPDRHTAVCVQAGDCLENSHWALVLILDCHQDLSYGTVRKRKVSLRH